MMSQVSLREAVQKRDTYMQTQEQTVMGKVMGKVIPFQQKEVSQCVG
jgi:hypothetical protein